MKNRVGRVIVGILALILLAFYTYRQEQIHWHSVDVDPWGPATGLHPEGFHADTVIGEQETEAPVQIGTVPAPSEEAAPAEETAAPAAPAEETEAPEPVVSGPQFDLSSWEFMLVNGDHSIDQYEPEQLGWVSNTLADREVHDTNSRADLVPVDARIAEPLLAMVGDCQDAGLPVYISSGYRSYSEQAANFRRICENNGITDGKDVNGHYITMPAGCSEHQTGLGVDVTDVYRAIKNDEFFQTETYQWLRDHCTDYGFILRFPTGKEDITGVMNEGWHFRYVGEEAARYIMGNDLTLEEFWDLFGENA